jgi:hypothetical protein
MVVSANAVGIMKIGAAGLGLSQYWAAKELNKQKYRVHASMQEQLTVLLCSVAVAIMNVWVETGTGYQNVRKDQYHLGKQGERDATT